MSEFSYKNGTLHAEDVPLEKIAEEYGTPTFVYSRKAIVEAYTRFKSAFDGRDHQICYAVKANSNLGVLSIFSGLGAGFDIVSGGELQRVLAAGGEPGKIVFSGVGKQEWEINLALEVGIACFNLESVSELRLLSELATSANKTAAISLRVNPDVDPKTHPYISTGLKDNKFGIAIHQAVDIYQEAAGLSGIKIEGVDFHIGSQITELSPFADTMVRILELVDDLEKVGISLSHIDLGGGIGITYDDENPIDIEEYASCILQAMGRRPQKLLFEPGRVFVGNAGVLLTRATTLKENGSKNYVVVDAAMNDLIRPALYQAWQRIESVTKSGDEPKTVDIVGPVCESSDFLGKDRQLSVAEGDLLAIHSAGAYGFGMSSNYNSRNRAAEVIVSGDRSHCVRKRETIADQLRLESVLSDTDFS
jgi:diaminopimelate decarboxylase